MGRLERLERQNRRLRLVVAWLVFLTLALAAIGVFVLLPVGKDVKEFQTIETGCFRLLDEQGRTRGELSMNDQLPGLVIFSRGGSPRVSLMENTGGAVALFLYDEWDGQHLSRRVELLASPKGTNLVFYDEKDVDRAKLIVDPKGTRLELFDERGKEIPHAP